MYWLRSAVLYLILAVLIGGSIWLFWGNAIETRLKKLMAESAKPESKKNKPAEKKIPLKSQKEKGKAEVRKVTPGEEWQKTRSGILALIALEADDNRRQLQRLAELSENRWQQLLRRPSTPLKNETTRPIAEQESKPKKSRLETPLPPEEVFPTKREGRRSTKP